MEWRVYPYAVTGKRSLVMYCTETPTDGVLGVGELVVSIALVSTYTVGAVIPRKSTETSRGDGDP